MYQCFIFHHPLHHPGDMFRYSFSYFPMRMNEIVCHNERLRNAHDQNTRFVRAVYQIYLTIILVILDIPGITYIPGISVIPVYQLYLHLHYAHIGIRSAITARTSNLLMIFYFILYHLSLSLRHTTKLHRYNYNINISIYSGLYIDLLDLVLLGS